MSSTLTRLLSISPTPLRLVRERAETDNKYTHITSQHICGLQTQLKEGISKAIATTHKVKAKVHVMYLLQLGSLDCDERIVICDHQKEILRAGWPHYESETKRFIVVASTSRATCTKLA